MKSYHKESSQFFETTASPEVEKFIDKNLSISIQVLDYLKEFGWSQKDFAKRLGKSDAEVSKWLSGMHNLTLKSLVKIETVLNRDILLTPNEAKRKYQNIKYVSYKVHATSNNKLIHANFTDYKKSGLVIKKAI